MIKILKIKRKQEVDLIKKYSLKQIHDSIELDFIIALLEIETIDDEIKKNFIGLQKIKKIEDYKLITLKLDEFYKKISVSQSLLLSIIDLETKLQDVLRRIRRKLANDNINNENFDNKTYSLSKILKQCFEKNLLPSVIQGFINKYFQALYSLTPHPTNPTSLEYTIVGNQFDALISDKINLSYKKLYKMMQKLILCPITSSKKTYIDEMIETELALKNIEIAEKNLILKWQSEIDRSAFSSQIFIPKQIAKIAVWSHGGDADGNPNITAHVLQEGINRIKKLKLRTKIDIRHDAKDIEECFNKILNNLNKSIILSNNEEQKIFDIECIINNQKLCQEIADSLQKNCEYNHEIIKRLILVNKNQRLIDKIIISNHSKVSQILLVLLLLKLTNSKLTTIPINIVTLSESLEDLQNIFKIYLRLIESKTYQKHLNKTHKIIAMIAKSDTLRVAGVAVDFYQNQACGQILMLKKIIQEKLNIECSIHVFSGGGNSLARGGGDLNNIPLKHAIFAIIEAQKQYTNHSIVDASYTTIQGQQQQILFSSIKNSENAIEIYALNNLISALLSADHIMLEEIDQYKNNSTRKDFSDDAINVYQTKYYQNKFVNELFFNANHLGVALANLSSRPLKRGQEQQNIITPIIYEKFRGELEDYNLFTTRAITLDRTIAHTATFVLMFFGVREALEKIINKDNGLENLNNLYSCNKAFKDFIRNQIIALHLVDINFAWKMLIGIDRPNYNKILKLADKFENLTLDKSFNLYQRQEITLAFIDKYIFDIGAIISKMIFNSDKFLDYNKYNLHLILEKYNQDLANQMNYRKKNTSFTRYLESLFVSELNKKPSSILNENDLKKIHSLYIANNPIFNTPIYLNSIRTAFHL